MVKKKVSKKKVSSNSRKTQKNSVHKKTVTEKSSVVQVIRVPIQTQNEILNINQNVEEQVQPEQIRIEPAPIFIDDTKEASKEANVSMIIKIFAITLCCIVVLFWIGLAALSFEYNPGPRIIAKNVSITTYSYTPVSLVKFMNISDIKYSENIIQLGYLREEKTDQGFIKKYLVDDKSNKVELLLDSNSQGAIYNKLFIMDNTTKELYNITGIYEFKINGFMIEVENITPAYKTLMETSMWSVQNITTDDVKGVTFDISRGVNKIIKFV